MLRTFALGLFAVCCAVAALSALRPEHTNAPTARAAPLKTVPVDDPALPLIKQANNLPIAKVVLFNSGVAYFQREGDVEGDARVDLQFPASDINDLIKSLVLEDANGGKAQALRYDSQEPIDKTLRSFAIDLSANPGYGQILNQARGSRVEVTTTQNAGAVPGQLTGVVVGMESRQTPGQPEVELLNLLCQEGIRAIPLSQITRLRFMDPALESELRRALEVVATGHDAMKKSVQLGFKGAGKRKVRVGYVVENPIWKTSYRLVMDGDKKATLHGWAAIENMGDEDWSDVRLTLVSGRPISFQMDLYPPLSIPRPVVEPELFASLRPPTYEGPMTGAANLGFGGGIAGLGGPMNFNNNIDPMMANPMFQGQGGAGIGGGFNGQFGFQGGQFGGQFGQQGGQGNNRYANPNFLLNNANGMPKLSYEELQQRRTDNRNNKEQQKQQAKDVGSALSQLDTQVLQSATADDLGLPSRYAIEEKVTLSRKQSAMLPILEQPAEVERVSIYNEAVQAKHPLLGLKFKNTSKQALMQGPIAIYEDGQYAGDARVMDLQPGEERLISYAIDLGTEVTTTARQAPGPKLLVRLEGASLKVQYTLRTTKTYAIKNRSPNDRTMVIEQPVRGDWKLVEPAKAVERSRDVYRFNVPVKAGEEVAFAVAEEQTRLDPFEVTKDANWTGFATALGLDVWTESKRSPEELPRIHMIGRDLMQAGPGTMEVTHHHRNAMSYFVRNKSKEDREVILEHHVEKGRQVVNAKDADEAVGQKYRFTLKLPAGKVASQEVIEEWKEAKPESFTESANGAPPRPGTDDPPVVRFVTELGFDAWLGHSGLASEVTEAKLDKGELNLKTKKREQFAHHVRNTTEAEKSVYVDHVVRPAWTTTMPNQPLEGQGQRYRSKLTIAPGKVARHEVVEEMTTASKRLLTALTETEVKELVESAAVPVAVKDAIRKSQELSKRLATTQAALSEMKAEVKTINEEQSRLRQNMEKLPPETTLYKRYLMKLDDQETTLEKVQKRIEVSQEEEKKQREELTTYLAGLSAG